ncbi:probable inactive serine/threonine-protein kinase bub1 [Zophobas morio]|uniref:probable inactive serine/threonine-protein kinase bub1 n=1 Tax=Zophobas morio TaxID=2755281 RepID=UPI003083C4A9
MEQNWESFKENIEPLRQGRQVEELYRIINSDDLSNKRDLQDSIRKFELKLLNSELQDDPLEDWLSYKSFLQQQLYKGDEKRMMNFYERCLQKFQGDEQYENDPRFLRLCIDYADSVDDPDDIFHYLLRSNIGAKLSLLYETYAVKLEDCGNFRKADEIYLLGLERKAQPLSRLTKSYEAFQHRLAEKLKAQELTENPYISACVTGAGGLSDPAADMRLPAGDQENIRKSVLMRNLLFKFLTILEKTRAQVLPGLVGHLCTWIGGKRMRL